MLLHVWFIVSFGDATGARAIDGANVLGGFTARLQGIVNNASTVVPAPAPAPAPARSADISASVGPLSPSLSADATSSVPPPLPEQASPPAAVVQAEKIVVPELVPLLAKEVDVPATAFVVPLFVPPIEAAVRKAPAIPSPPAVANAAPVAITSLPNIEPTPASRIEREIAPALVAPMSVAAPALIAPIAAARATPNLAPVVQATPETPIPVAIPAAIAPTVPTAAATPVLAAPEPIPMTPAKVVEVPVALPPALVPTAIASPAKTERDLVPYAAPLLSDLPSAKPEASARVPSAAPTTATSARPVNAPVSATGAAARATDDIFGARRDGEGGGAPGTAKATPRIDLDAARQRARELGSEGTGPRTVFAFPTPPPEVVKKKKVEEVFDKALKRPDCKDAYSDMGLAAVVPLVRDAVTEKGCKW